MSDLGSIAGMPTWHPSAEVLEIAELVISGVVEVPPVPIGVPDELAAAATVVLEDAEGTPVATLSRLANGAAQVFGPVRPFSHGPVRAARVTPAQVKAELEARVAPGGVLAVPVSTALSEKTVDELLARAAAADQTMLWLAVFGTGRPAALPPSALWRAVRALAEQATVAGRPSLAVPVAVPGLDNGSTSLGDAGLLIAVAHGYGATEVVDPAVLSQPESESAVEADLHPAFQIERERRRPADRRGVTIFFTGLSGSGKSTVAKALAARLEEEGRRTVSLLDGDEVRRLLSAGLSFSRADRDLNIRRIGFVAAEVNRHGGLAVCAPIAPFAQARDQVRAAVEAAGGDFVLIYISTSLEECERRDRKGLYAQARQGLIADFTGISSPYEVPVDADLTLDTAQLEVSRAVDTVWELLSTRSYLPR